MNLKPFIKLFPDSSFNISLHSAEWEKGSISTSLRKALLCLVTPPCAAAGGRGTYITHLQCDAVTTNQNLLNLVNHPLYLLLTGTVSPASPAIAPLRTTAKACLEVGGTLARDSGLAVGQGRQPPVPAPVRGRGHSPLGEVLLG